MGRVREKMLMRAEAERAKGQVPTREQTIQNLREHARKCPRCRQSIKEYLRDFLGVTQ
jgi:hypothetical protein